MPVTAEGMASLFHSTYAYETRLDYLPETKIRFENDIVKLLKSPEEKYILVEEVNGVITILDSATYEVVRTIDAKYTTDDNLSNVYDKAVYKYDYASNSMDIVYNFANIDTDSDIIQFIAGDMCSYTYRFTRDDKSLQVFGKIDLTNGQVISQIELETNMLITDDFYVSEDKVCMIGTAYDPDERYSYDTKYIYCYSKSDSKLEWKVKLYNLKSDVFTFLSPCVTADGIPVCICVVGNYFYELDENTGEVCFTKEYDANIIKIKKVDLPSYPDVLCFHLVLENGSYSYLLPDNRSYETIAEHLGKKLVDLIFTKDRFIVYSEKSKDLVVSAQQKGLRIQMTDCDYDYSEKYCYDPSLEACYYTEDCTLYAKNIETREILWSIDLDVDKMYTLGNGTLFVSDSSNDKIYLIDRTSGNIIYQDLNTMFHMNVDYENSVIYYNTTDQCYKFDATTYEKTELFRGLNETLENSEFGKILENEPKVFSDDGKYLIYEELGGEYFVLKEDGEGVQLPVPEYMVDRLFFLPDFNCLLVHLYDKTYEVYDCDTMECLYTGEDEIDDTIVSVVKGDEDLPYYLICGGSLVILDSEFKKIYSVEGFYHYIDGSGYFAAYNDKKILFVPLYTVEMLKEDAQKLMPGEASAEYFDEEE